MKGASIRRIRGKHYDNSMFNLTVSPEEAPDIATEIEIDFKRGDPVAINGEALSPADLLAKLNELGGSNGVGRIDIVESRYVGIKARGVL